MHLCATIALFALASTTPIHAHPLQLLPRAGISQNSEDAIAPFKSLCNSLERGLKQPQCNDLIVLAQPGILAAADVCAQQDRADDLVDLAHHLNSTQLAKMARLWMQQPRSSTSSLSMPYCPRPPRNPELYGVYQCQFAGADPNNFATTQSGRPTPVGANLTIPFGLDQPVNPPGSCPDFPQGPVPDQAQLTCLVLQRGAQSGGHGDEDGDDDENDSDDEDSDDDDDDNDNSRMRRRVKDRRGNTRSNNLLKTCRNLGH